MTSPSRLVLRAVAVAVLAAAVGCGRGSSATAVDPPADPRSPAEYFKDRQAATITPNGRILTDTVAEKDGRIEYVTEDGKQWRVAYSRRVDGMYDWGTPEEVK